MVCLSLLGACEIWLMCYNFFINERAYQCFCLTNKKDTPNQVSRYIYTVVIPQYVAYSRSFPKTRSRNFL